MKRKRTAKFEKVECMECHGMFYTNVLSQHIKKEHNLLEYIEKYGEFRKNKLEANKPKKRKVNKIICKICQMEFTVVGFSGHLSDTHNMTTDDYVEKYGEFRKKFLDYNKRAKENKIVCLVCNKEFGSERLLTYHIRKEHCMTKRDYVINYVFQRNIPKCKCGCGKEVKILNQPPYSNDFVTGHNSIGENNSMFNKKHNIKTKQRMSNSAIKKVKYYKENGIVPPWKSKKALIKRGAKYSKLMMSRKEKKYNVKIIERKGNYLKFSCNKCGKIYEQFHNSYFLCTNCFPRHRSNIEEELYKYLVNECKLNIIQNSRSFIKPYEIDFYHLKKKIGIELNGLYYHSVTSGNKQKNYHLNKTEMCIDNGIKLIQIFEDEWRNKKEIVKERLKYILNVKSNKQKIYARKCIVKEIITKEKNEFLNKYHTQGQDISKVKLGLFYNEKLISVMTFGGLRIALGQKQKKENNFELIRFCNNYNYLIVGSAGKLLSYFVKNYNPIKIISYADRRWSTGNLYEKLGFKKVSNGTPNYWYTNDYKHRLHRFNFTKKQLINAGADVNKTEWEIMQENKYDKIWDCGSLKYEIVYC